MRFCDSSENEKALYEEPEYLDYNEKGISKVVISGEKRRKKMIKEGWIQNTPIEEDLKNRQNNVKIRFAEDVAVGKSSYNLGKKRDSLYELYGDQVSLSDYFGEDLEGASIIPSTKKGVDGTKEKTVNHLERAISKSSKSDDYGKSNFNLKNYSAMCRSDMVSQRHYWNKMEVNGYENDYGPDCSYYQIVPMKKLNTKNVKYPPPTVGKYYEVTAGRKKFKTLEVVGNASGWASVFACREVQD